MHNPALQAAGIEAQYVRVQVPVGAVSEAFRLFQDAGFVGVNVTIPHKLEALEAVDQVDPLARQLGAVNTVCIRDGRLLGYNSDGPGFLRAVQEAFETDLRDLRVMILGAGGGAGRAVAVQCALHGCWKLLLSNRTEDKARTLMRELRALSKQTSPVREIATVRWDTEPLRRELENVDLIVNATSLGMKPGDPPLVPPGSLRPHHFVFDMVYGARTPLIDEAKQAGAKWVDGLSLLLHQGAISFEHWFNRAPSLEVMRRGLENDD